MRLNGGYGCQTDRGPDSRRIIETLFSKGCAIKESCHVLPQEAWSAGQKPRANKTSDRSSAVAIVGDAVPEEPNFVVLQDIVSKSIVA